MYFQHRRVNDGSLAESDDLYDEELDSSKQNSSKEKKAHRPTPDEISKIVTSEKLAKIIT